MTLPTKGLPRARRRSALRQRALGRYWRRAAIVEWFWNWTHKRWGKPPNCSTKVEYSWVRFVPIFATFRPRVHHYRHHDGKEVRFVGQQIYYEDCVHLADQAHALLGRLERKQAT